MPEPPTKRMLRRRSRLKNRRRLSFVLHKLSSFTTFFSQTASRLPVNKGLWAAERSRRPRLRQRRRSSLKSRPRHFSSRTTISGRLHNYLRYSSMWCTIHKTWYGSTSPTTIWRRLRLTSLSSKILRHSIYMVTTSRTSRKPRNSMALETCRRWLCMTTLSRRSNSTASGYSVSCTLTTKTCAALTRSSSLTANSTKSLSGRRTSSQAGTSACESSNQPTRSSHPRSLRMTRRRRSRATEFE